VETGEVRRRDETREGERHWRQRLGEWATKNEIESETLNLKHLRCICIYIYING